MGQHRHVTNLRAFAGTLSFETANPDPWLPLTFEPAAGQDADPPAPVDAYAGTKATAEGLPILEWRILSAAAERAREKGVEPVELAGREGEFILVKFRPDTLALCAFDDQFEAARERGDAVILGDDMFILLDAPPALN